MVSNFEFDTDSRHSKRYVRRQATILLVENYNLCVLFSSRNCLCLTNQVFEYTIHPGPHSPYFSFHAGLQEVGNL